MLNRFFRRTVCVLLTIAMALSFACIAAAADIQEQTAEDEQLVLAEEVVSAEALLETDEAEEAEETEAVSDDDVTADTAEADKPVVKEEQTEPSAPAAEPEPDGWSVAVGKDGKPDYSFTYQTEHDGHSVAANGFYQISETITVEQSGQQYTFKKGIYRFEADGTCTLEQEQGNILTQVNTLKRAGDCFVVAGQASMEISLGDVESDEKHIVTSGVALYTGVELLDGVYHSFKSGKDQGLYTGTLKPEGVDAVCYAKKGKLLTKGSKEGHWYGNTFYTFEKKLTLGAEEETEEEALQTAEADAQNEEEADEAQTLAVGTPAEGAYKVTEVPAELGKKMTKNGVYYFKKGKPTKAKNAYATCEGKLYLFNVPKKMKNGYAVGTAVNGYVPANQSYYKNGKVDTGLTGWKKISKNTYYFKKGEAVTGWNYLKRNGDTYKYFFRDNGTLVEDLYAYFGKSYYKKKQRLDVNRYTNNVTFYQYDSKTGKYDIPLRSSIVATNKRMNVHFGTYSLKTMQRGLYKDGWYWRYLTYIGHTGALFHSCRFYNRNVNSMCTSNYNSLGRCASAKCFRAQVDTVRLIYDLAETQGDGELICRYYSTKNEGPFGRRTLENTTGKLSGKMHRDPTE